ncbi:MAG: hypothetical protein ACI9OH_001618 [Oleispira sp.]|jgi:hypothetical protein
MNWEIDNNFCHRVTSSNESEAELKEAVLEAADYAFDLLHENIEDDSMFCLFDWNFAKQRLLIAVTDPSKKKLAKHTVELTLTGYASHIADKKDQQEQIQLWVHNHITTAANFLQFSLVAAIIADGDVDSSILL